MALHAATIGQFSVVPYAPFRLHRFLAVFFLQPLFIDIRRFLCWLYFVDLYVGITYIAVSNLYVRLSNCEANSNVEQKKDRKHRKAKLWASVEHSLDKAS